jgi:hypothetical protein
MVPNTLPRAAAVTGCRRPIPRASDVRPQPTRRPSPEGHVRSADLAELDSSPNRDDDKAFGKNPGAFLQRCMSPFPLNWRIPCHLTLSAFASLNALDRLQFVRRRKLTVLSFYCHRSSSKCLSQELSCLTQGVQSSTVTVTPFRYRQHDVSAQALGRDHCHCFRSLSTQTTTWRCSRSGTIAAPTGNICISCRESTTTNGLLNFKASGNGKDGVVSAVRIQQANPVLGRCKTHSI